MLAKNTIIVLIIAVIYFVFGKLGLSLAFFHASATPVWPSTGIAIAAFLILGKKVWPGIFLGAFLVNLTTQGTVFTSLGIALGNTLEGFISYLLITKFLKNQNPFLTPSDIFKYIIIAGFTTLVSAVIGTFSLFLGGFLELQSYLAAFFTWWFGDLGGAIIVAPLIVLWWNNRSIFFTPDKMKEGLVIGLVTVFFAILIFGKVLPETLVDFALPFIYLPILVWIAYRFSPRETSTAIFIVAVLAVLATLEGYGPFIRSGPNFALLMLQIFMGTTFLSVMPLSAAIFEERKTSERYKKLLDTSPDPIVLLDFVGKVIQANTQTALMYRFKDAQEMIGVNGFDLVAEEDLPKTQKILGETLKKGVVRNVEYTSRRKDGSKFYARTNAAVYYDDYGRPEGLVGVVHDITQEKEADQAKTDFFALAAHQLRTPLSTMRWNLEMLVSGKMGQLAEPAYEKVKAVLKSNLGLITLVNTLLDTSMIEQGVFPNNPEATDISDLIKTVVEEMKYESEKRSIRIELKARNKVIPVEIDPIRFKEAISNLISNAIKYSPDNETVTIVIGEDRTLKIEIADNGIGIPQRYKDKIFTKYYRTPEAKEVDKYGTGMGLYMVKSYIDLIGGKISYRSPINNGKGTIFSIEIPKKGAK